jgi:hypothetical protein
VLTKKLRSLATVLAAGAVFATAPGVASAAQSTTVTVKAASVGAAQEKTIAQDLRAGETVDVVAASGVTYSVRVENGTAVVTANGRPEAVTGSAVKPAADPCAVAVTAGIFALGAALIGLLAVTTDGIAIAGVFITAAELGQLAALMAVPAAVYGFVALYVC